MKIISKPKTAVRKKKKAPPKAEPPANPWLSLKLDPGSSDRWYWGSSTEFPLCKSVALLEECRREGFSFDLLVGRTCNPWFSMKLDPGSSNR